MDGIVKAFEYFGRRAAVGFVVPEWLPTQENGEYRRAVDSLDATVYRIVSDRRAALAEAAASTGEEPKLKVTGISTSSAASRLLFRLLCLHIAAHSASALQGLIDQLLITEDDEGNGMSDRELRDEIMTMMVAGQETSAILLTWACALLAWHPEAQVT
jgi:cytochrome P450